MSARRIRSLGDRQITFATFSVQPVEEPSLDSGNDDVSRSCVLEKYVGHILRQNLRNMVEGICPQRKFVRKLYASQFQVAI